MVLRKVYERMQREDRDFYPASRAKRPCTPDSAAPARLPAVAGLRAGFFTLLTRAFVFYQTTYSV